MVGSAPVTPPCDAIVAGDRLAADGVPTFTSLAVAIAAVPPDGDAPFRIFLSEGVWRERVAIDRPNVRLIGAGTDRTTLVFSRNAGIPGADGRPIGTFNTATLTVAAPGFSAEALTIANDYDYLTNMPPPGSDGRIGVNDHQAVALAIQGEADRSLFRDVRLVGHQDTLFVDAGRSLFQACRVEGSVDFIFGAGSAAFDDCVVVSRARPGQAFSGFIAAPNTDIGREIGLVFRGCRLEKETGVAPRTVALGRPWRRTTHFPDGFYGDPADVGACVYLDCWMDDHIVAEGWHPMGYNAKGGGRSVLFPEEARFFEYLSDGPGAGAPSASRRVLSPDEASVFGRERLPADWFADDRP